MSWANEFYLQDVLEARERNVDATKDRLRKIAERRLGIRWNYNTAFIVCRNLPGGTISRKVALSAAESIRNPIGRRNNLAVISEAYSYFSGLVGNFYEVERDLYRLSGLTSCQVKMLGLFHDGKNQFLYWPQFRKYSTLETYEYAVVFSVLRSLYGSDPDYKSGILKIVDVSARGKADRRLRVIDAGRIPMLSEEQLVEYFDPICHALQELIAEGFEPRQETKRKPSDDEHPKLFE